MISRLITTGLVCGVLIVGCQGESTDGTQTSQNQQKSTRLPLDEETRPSYVPEPTATEGLPRAVLDTLIAHRDLHRITRDEYWPTRGGVLANPYFEIWYPRGRYSITHAMHVMDVLMPARKSFKDRFGAVPDQPLVVRFHAYMESYKERTGRDFWHYSVTRGDTVTYQPPFILSKRGLDHIALPREFFEWALRRSTNNAAPMWFEQGLCAYLSNEGTVLREQTLEFPERNNEITVAQIDAALQAEVDKAETRLAYYHSYMMVKNIIDTYGESSVDRTVADMRKGASFDEALPKNCNASLQQVMTAATNYVIDF